MQIIKSTFEIIRTYFNIFYVLIIYFTIIINITRVIWLSNMFYYSMLKNKSIDRFID
jgi:hypothetical protein